MEMAIRMERTINQAKITSQELGETFAMIVPYKSNPKWGTDMEFLPNVKWLHVKKVTY